MGTQAIGRNTVAGELLRGFVERVENIDVEMKQLRDDKGVIFAEAKAANIQPAGIRYIVRKRAQKPSARAETASPALMRQFCENLKRAIIVGPKLNLDMRREAVISRLIASVKPHPDLGKPRLWSEGEKDHAVELMPWPLQRAGEVVEETEIDADSAEELGAEVVSINGRKA